MQESLNAQNKESVVTAEPIDPRRFDDPVAERTKWTPVAPGDNVSESTRIKMVTRQRLVFSPAWGAYAVFGWVMFPQMGERKDRGTKVTGKLQKQLKKSAEICCRQNVLF